MRREALAVIGVGVVTGVVAALVAGLPAFPAWGVIGFAVAVVVLQARPGIVGGAGAATGRPVGDGARRH